jgi:cation transport ATPase
MAAFALGLGVITTFRVHLSHIEKRTKGQWIFSIWTIGLFVLLALTGVINPKIIVYDWTFTYVYTALSTTLYATTGFYIFSAAYRAFRARNLEAAILIISGVLILLRNAPIGEVIWSGFPVLGEWVLMKGQVGGMRTLTFVAAVGLIGFGIRTLLGMERGYFGGGVE